MSRNEVVGAAVCLMLLSGSAAAVGAERLHVITFDDPANAFRSGDVVGEIRTGAGRVQVQGKGPRSPLPNDAMIFDATCTTCRGDRRRDRPCRRCTGGDEDLRFPEQHNILVVSESGLPDDPGDSGFGGLLHFDFASVGRVRIESLTAIDLEDDSPAVARLYRGDRLVAERRLPTPGDGKRERALLGVADVDRLEVEFEGSGAIDDLAFCVGTDPELECADDEGAAEPLPAATPATGPDSSTTGPGEPHEAPDPTAGGPTEESEGAGDAAGVPEVPSPPTPRIELEEPALTTSPGSGTPPERPPLGRRPVSSLRTPTEKPEEPIGSAAAAPTPKEPASPTGGGSQDPTGSTAAPPSTPRDPLPASSSDPDAGAPAGFGPGEAEGTEEDRPPLWIWFVLVLIAIGILLIPRFRAAKHADYTIVEHPRPERRWVSAPRFDRSDVRPRGGDDHATGR